MPPDRQRPPTSSLFRGLVFFIQSRGNPKLWDDINFIQNHGGGATRDPSNRQLTHVVLNVQNDDNSSCSLQEYPVRDTPLPRLRESWGLNDLLLKFTMSSRTRGPVVVVVDRQWLFECVKRQCVLGPREVRPYGGWQVLGRFGGSGAPPRDNGAKDQIAAEWGDYYSRARPPTSPPPRSFPDRDNHRPARWRMSSPPSSTPTMRGSTTSGGTYFSSASSSWRAEDRSFRPSDSVNTSRPLPGQTSQLTERQPGHVRPSIHPNLQVPRFDAGDRVSEPDSINVKVHIKDSSEASNEAPEAQNRIDEPRPHPIVTHAQAQPDESWRPSSIHDEGHPLVKVEPIEAVDSVPVSPSGVPMDLEADRATEGDPLSSAQEAPLVPATYVDDAESLLFDEWPRPYDEDEDIPMASTRDSRSPDQPDEESVAGIFSESPNGPVTFYLDDPFHGLQELIRMHGGQMAAKEEAQVVVLPLDAGVGATLPCHLELLKNKGISPLAYVVSHDWVWHCIKMNGVVTPNDGFKVKVARKPRGSGIASGTTRRVPTSS